MLMNEHRCAVSVILLKPENKSFSQFLHRCSKDAQDVPDSHLHVLLSKKKEKKKDEWQDLGPWIKKKYINKKVNVSMLTFGKIHQILWFSIMFLKVFRK